MVVANDSTYENTPVSSCIEGRGISKSSYTGVKAGLTIRLP